MCAKHLSLVKYMPSARTSLSTLGSASLCLRGLSLACPRGFPNAGCAELLVGRLASEVRPPSGAVSGFVCARGAPSACVRALVAVDMR